MLGVLYDNLDEEEQEYYNKISEGLIDFWDIPAISFEYVCR